MEDFYMDWLLILLSVFGSLLALFLFYYLIKRNKKHFIPSLIFVVFGLVMILLSQNVDTGGGFLDLIYMLFGILSMIAGVIIALIVLALLSYRKNKE